MLANSFCHIKGVGDKAEKKLWDEGIHSWEMLFSASETSLSKAKRKRIEDELLHSKNALNTQDHAYFSRNLRSSEHWRLFREFKDSAVYLDIETTGLDIGYSTITTCVLYDGKHIKYYVNGQNLDQLVPDLQQYSVIITYNGRCFDIPFIEGIFNVKLSHSQIDLRFVLAQLGYKGGLKGCEKQFGLSRDDVEGIDGYFAVLLWREYIKGKKTALDTLLAYNCEDVLNLEHLMHCAYNLKIKNTLFEDSHTLAIPQKPESEFKADRHLVNQLLNRYAYYVIKNTLTQGNESK